MQQADLTVFCGKQLVIIVFSGKKNDYHRFVVKKFDYNGRKMVNNVLCCYEKNDDNPFKMSLFYKRHL